MAQYARPSSDIALNSWTYSTGSTLYGCIDEVTPSDTDYITRPKYGASECELGLSSVTDPSSSSDHTMRVRAKDGPGSSLTVSLYSASTLIKAWSVTVPNNWSTQTYTLTGTEADSITDYGDLEVRINATAGNNDTDVSWFEFEVPDATGPISINLSAASVTAAGQAVGVVPGAALVNLDAASITASGQVLSVVPGAASINLAAGSVLAAGQVLDIVPGAVSVSLAAGSVLAAGQVLGVVPGAASINLAAGSVLAAGQFLVVVPGAASVALSAASVSIDGQVITVIVGAADVNINLDAASVTAAGQSVSVIPGAAFIDLSAGSITASGQPISVVPGAAVIELDAAIVNAAGQTIAVLPGAASIDLSTAIVTTAGQQITVVVSGLDITIDLSAASVLASAQPVTVVPAGAFIDLAAGSVTTAGQVLSVVLSAPRVLRDGEPYGSQLLYVDPSVAGAYDTIQEALDAAQAETPAAGSRWLILIAPGEYQESLTLYDYVDLSGYAPGYGVNLVSPPSQAAIANAAECTISNICIYGTNSTIINTGAGFTGEMVFYNCRSIDYGVLVNLIKVTSGTIRTYFCDFYGSDTCVLITGGSFYSYHSNFTRDGSFTGYPVEINGAITFEAYSTLFNNTGSGGGSAIYIHTTTPTSLILHHCIYRKASGSESISTDITPTIYTAGSVANAALDAAITGTHDVQVDSNY